ncbi:VOC family protein [Yinghuangia sp. YIM S09857]|uniref:VOC family protein n=1 Tax=Yinghuangia sp. YIM S09857 TaxID=3436929 RepID=UPI003F52B115
MHDPAHRPLGGVFEATHGVADLESASSYWQLFGFRPGPRGEADADTAMDLYGVPSAVRSLRMYHGRSDHGLLRLMQWQNPTGPGVGAEPLRTPGGRWTVQMTTALLELQSHAELADEAGELIHIVFSAKQVFGGTPDGGRHVVPFHDRLPLIREAVVTRGESRQVFFERHGYTVPHYGALVDARFMASQFTHVGLIHHGDPGLLDFYDRGLGLLRVTDGHVSGDEDPGGKKIFGRADGETTAVYDFDDTRSGPTPAQARSGRLKIAVFDPATAVRAGIDPGSAPERTATGRLGPSSYSYRVADLAGMRAQVADAGATSVTGIRRNEFGEPSLSFTAPDGHTWLLVGAHPTPLDTAPDVRDRR